MFGPRFVTKRAHNVMFCYFVLRKDLLVKVKLYLSLKMNYNVGFFPTKAEKGLPTSAKQTTEDGSLKSFLGFRTFPKHRLSLVQEGKN